MCGGGGGGGGEEEQEPGGTDLKTRTPHNFVGKYEGNILEKNLYTLISRWLIE